MKNVSMALSYLVATTVAYAQNTPSITYQLRAKDFETSTTAQLLVTADTAARMSQETVAAQDMLTRFAQWQGLEPESVAADTTYGNGEFLQWLADRNITAYMRNPRQCSEKEQSRLWP